MEEDERRLSKLSIRDEEVGLESDEEETGMILKETKYQTTRLQKTTKDYKITIKDNKKSKICTTKNNKNIKDNKRLQRHKRHQTDNKGSQNHDSCVERH